MNKKNRKRMIYGASVVIILLFLIPTSMGIGIPQKPRIKILDPIIEDGIQSDDVDGVPHSPDDDEEYIVIEDVMPQAGTISILTDPFILENENDIFYFNLPEPNLNAYAGDIESINMEPLCTAEPIAHSWNPDDIQGDDVHIGQYIHADIYLTETRETFDKAYLLKPRIDYKCELLNDWILWKINGPNIIIWENTSIPIRTHLGEIGLGKISEEDNIFYFRLRMEIWIEVERTEEYVKFKFFDIDTDNGIWYFDIGPWNEH